MSNEYNILNNSMNLTEHFLYTYNSYAKTGPQDNVKSTLNEDLIFDKSRKSIFTQGQEFGYVSDTVYTAFINKNASTYITLRSYEGNIEMYRYEPFEINNVSCILMTDSDDFVYPEVIDNIYEAGKPTTIDSCVVEYVGNDTIIYSYVSINHNKISEKTTFTDNGCFEYLSSECRTATLLPGLNEIEIFAYAVANTYFNDNQNIVHQTIPRFNKQNIVSYSSYCIDIIAYNPTYLLKLNGTYWTIKDNINTVQITDSNTIRKVFTDDWGCATSNNHIICSNVKNETITLVVPQRLQNDNTIYGNVSGCAQEFHKLKTTYLNVGVPENYNFYVATSDNWNGQTLYFNSQN